MIDGLPTYVVWLFLLTTIFTVWYFTHAIIRERATSLPGRILLGVLFIYLAVHPFLAYNGFFRDFEAMPPRVFAFGPLPLFLLTIAYLIFFRNSFLDHLPLKALTLIHVIRIPVEIVLLWLYQHGQIPVEMTFEGRNFDIVSGITAPIVYFLAFRGDRVNRPLLIVWNIGALALLVNIVTIAVLAFPGWFQTIGIEQPNIGVTYFPFIYLPAVIVPIVFFCHAVSLYKLFSGRESDGTAA